MHNILSPDGFKLRHEDFKTEQDAINYFQEWKQGFVQQGYYSANNRRIALEDLEDEVELFTIKTDTDDNY